MMKSTHLLVAVVAVMATPFLAARPVAADHDTSTSLVDTVRHATYAFQDPSGLPSGYAPVLGCVAGPFQGAMGVHYVKSALFGAGAVDPNHPEAIIYEPRNGHMRLVGTEFIILADVWNASHTPDDPPQLQGHLMNYVAAPNRFGPAFYEIHVWAWRYNPHGTFADWNPRVSCAGV